MGTTIARFRAAHNLENFCGNGCLTSLVVAELEVAKHFACVLGGLVHGCHPGSVLRRVAVEQCLVQLNLQRVRHDVLGDHLAARLEDVVNGSGHGFRRLLDGRLLNWKHLLAHHILNGSIDEAIVQDFHLVILPGSESLHHLGGRIGRPLEIEVVEDGVWFITKVQRREMLRAPEHVGALLSEAEYVYLLSRQLLQALVGELYDVVVERSTKASIRGHGHKQDALDLPLDSIHVLGGIQGSAHVDQNLLQLLRIGPHPGNGVLCPAQLRRGHQFHRLRNLPGAPDRGNPVAYFLEAGHGSDQLANCLLTSSAAAVKVAWASSEYLPVFSSAMVSACLERR